MSRLVSFQKGTAMPPTSLSASTNADPRRHPRNRQRSSDAPASSFPRTEPTSNLDSRRRQRPIDHERRTAHREKLPEPSLVVLGLLLLPQCLPARLSPSAARMALRRNASSSSPRKSHTPTMDEIRAHYSLKNRTVAYALE